jgi:hypothetical protein
MLSFRNRSPLGGGGGGAPVRSVQGGRGLLYLMEPVVEIWNMEIWLKVFSSLWEVLRVGPSSGRVLFYLVLSVGASSGGSMEMWDMETWLHAVANILLQSRGGLWRGWSRG